jgi:uncharacterized protein with HEPN domain
MKDNTVYLQHILEAIHHIESFIGTMNYSAFAQDEKTIAAVLHELMIIGEAAAAISPSFRAQHPEIPFYEIIGMRNRIVHEYLEVRLETVWQTYEKDLPELKRYIQGALQ